MKLNNNLDSFFALLRLGLWGAGNLDTRIDGTADWQEVYRLATEQSVLGLVLAGLEFSDIKPPELLLLQWIGEVQVIEQRNKDMNAFIADLIEKLRKEDVYAILVKGQGIAQCYEKPLWRTCGDVDLLLSDNNYQIAKGTLAPLASSVDEEDVKRRHLAMNIDSWGVELHGSLHAGITRKIDKGIDKVQEDIIYGGNVRSWMNGGVSVFLPSSNNDIVFVFTHILQHYFDGGIGLRQVCDWCRLLWTYQDEINLSLLRKRLKSMGIMTEWKAFASLAVDYLGMPDTAMPLYDHSSRYERKAKRILSLILETGNFGQGRDATYKQKNSFFVRLVISFSRHTKDVYRQFLIFPGKALWVWMKMVVKGVRFAIKCG